MATPRASVVGRSHGRPGRRWGRPGPGRSGGSRARMVLRRTARSRRRRQARRLVEQSAEGCALRGYAGPSVAIAVGFAGQRRGSQAPPIYRYMPSVGRRQRRGPTSGAGLGDVAAQCSCVSSSRRRLGLCHRKPARAAGESNEHRRWPPESLPASSTPPNYTWARSRCRRRWPGPRRGTAGPPPGMRSPGQGEPVVAMPSSVTAR